MDYLIACEFGGGPKSPGKMSNEERTSKMLAAEQGGKQGAQLNAVRALIKRRRSASSLFGGGETGKTTLGVA